MSDEQRQTMLETFFEVIEQMAFMFGEAAEISDLPGNIENGVRASMSFKGPFSGDIKLAVPAGICPVIAENMLGVEPGDERVMDKARDALKEVLNVTCGGLLTRIAGETPVFDLTVPEIADIGREQWFEMAQSYTVVAGIVEDFPVLLELKIW